MKKIKLFNILLLCVMFLFSACESKHINMGLPFNMIFTYIKTVSQCGIHIFDLSKNEFSLIEIDGYENTNIRNICGYSDGEFFACYETADECKILKVKDRKVVSVQDFEAEFKPPQNWEFNYFSILSMERYGNGVVFLSPSVNVYRNEPFYADIPSTLYYTDFEGLCVPILENVVSFKVYEDKICYCAFDENKLVEYGNTTIFSKININLYENGETLELFSSNDCPYESVEDWCNSNELLLMRNGMLVKYNIYTNVETVLLKPKVYYSFKPGYSIYVSDKHIIAVSQKQNFLARDCDLEYWYLFDIENGTRKTINESIFNLEKISSFAIVD